MGSVVLHRTMLAVLLSCGAGSAYAQPVADPHAQDFIPPGRKLSEDQLRRDQVRAVYSQRRQVGPPREVVYGPDDRLDRYQVGEEAWKSVGDSVCSVTTASNLADNGDGTYRLLDTGRFTAVLGTTVCDDEPFRGQLQLGYCSGFLVGPDLIATAGHCVSAPDAAFIFSFDQLGPMLGAPDEFDPAHIPASNVYFATQVVDRVFTQQVDYAIVKLDRAAVGRTPLALRRSGEPAAGQELLLVSHANNLPAKFDGGGVVRDANAGLPYFTANLDAFGGSSGAPVVDRATGLVEGILVRGNADFVNAGGCVRSKVCADGGCPGYEEITRSSVFAPSVPQTGVNVSPVGGVTSIGPVGGPFTSASVVYTLTNTAAEAAQYEARVEAGGTAPLLINGVSGPVAGVLPSGQSVPLTVAVAGSAGALPAGTYTSVVRIDDLTHGVSSTRTHRLEIGTSSFVVLPAAGVSMSGPTGGPFLGARFYSVVSTGATPVQVRVEGDQPWIGVDGGSAQNFVLGTLGEARTVVVNAAASASGLDAGVYQGVVTFTNQSGGSGSTSRDATIEVGRINYASTGPAITIPDRGSATSGVYVNEPWCVGDIDVSVDIAHGYVGDLIVDLIGPTGAVVRLKNRTGGDSVNFVGTFDQDGAAILPDGPGSLNDFDGSSASGLWLLRVTDNATGQAGAINGWTLRLVPRDGCGPIPQAQVVGLPPTHTTSVNLFATSFSSAPVTFRITSLPAHGELFDPAGGQILEVPYDVQLSGVEVRYRPALGFAGRDGFTYAAVESNVASVPAEIVLEVGVEREVARFSMASDPGWAREGAWQFGQPTGAGTPPGDPGAGFTGPNVMGFNLAGDYTNGMSGPVYTTTGPIDCSGVALPRVEFRRWLGIERSAFDRATISASVGAGGWTTVWTNPDDTVADGFWSLQSTRLPESAGGAADVRVRWGVGPTDALVTLPGWNIDDVRVVGLAAPSPACAIDLTLDSLVDLEDFFAFFNAFDQSLLEADVNGDGQVDSLDFMEFLAIWDSSGCS